MDNIIIQDSLQQIKFVLEDLRAIQTVIVMAEDNTVCTNEHETLMVLRRALDPIVGDLQEATDAIDCELKNIEKD